jgi:4-amino-4-deoxy-L-arabinose transferase-like glycosyltransferase
MAADAGGPRGDDPRGSRNELALVLLGHALLYVVLNGNFDHDYDAQQYGRIAHEIARGEYQLATHPFSQRFAVTAPAAALFRLGGVSWVTATLWPLVCSLGTIALVHGAAARAAGRRAALAAALLLATNLVQVRFASRLLPDVVVSAWMLAAAVAIERGRDAAPARQARAGLAAALLLLVALLAKETAVWLGPLFLGLCAYDLLRRKNARLWLVFAGTLGAGLAALAAAYAAATGDPLYRLQGIEVAHNERAGAFEGGLASYAARLTYAPLVFLLEIPAYGLALLLALPAAVFAARAPRHESGGARYWVAYLVSVVASFWLGTTSLREYTPLNLAERFLMPFLAPLSILGGITLALVLDPRERSRTSRLESGVLVAGASAAAALLARDGIKRAALYAALALLGSVAALRWRSAPRALAAALLALSAVPLADYLYRGDPHETPPLIQRERDLVAATFPLDGPPVAVLTDPHSVFVLPFYLPPAARDRVRLVSWDDPAAAVRDGERALAYVHQPRLIAINLNWGQRIPDFAQRLPESWRSIAECTLDSQHWIRLLEIDDPALALGH